MMTILKPESTIRNPEPTGNSRRSFIWKMGAGVSATLASAAGVAKAGNGNADTASAAATALRAAMLEEEKILRRLHQSFEQAMNKGLPDEVVGMFSEDADVIFNGDVFSQRRGVSRLYREHFLAGKTGRTMEPAPGFELAADLQRDHVEVSPDCTQARAVYPYSIQAGRPIESESSLAAMARLHGEGVQTWWEGGVYRVNYRKSGADGLWKISRLEYDTLSRADYRSGRSYAQPIGKWI